MLPRPPILVGIALGLAAALFFIGRLSPPSHARPTMLPDQGGPIRAVVMQYASGSQFVAPVYHDYLAWQTPDLTVYMACPEPADFREITDLLSGTTIRCKIIPVFTHHEMTAWSRDRWVALRNPDTQAVTLLSPHGELAQDSWPQRAGDSHIGDDLARALPGVFQAKRSGLYFDGGDFLADNGLVFVTRAVIDRNLQHTVPTREDLIRAITADLNCTPILLDNAPSHHAGMYMMAAGPAAPNPTAPAQRIMVVADPSLGQSVYTSSPDALFADGPDFSPETQQHFDYVAALAQKAGYRVVRIPVVPGHGTMYMTYVNVILDRDGQQPVVYMSSYQGQKRMNAAAAAVWKSLGYEVRPVDCSTVWQRGGTLHCLVNVFARDS